MTPAVLSRAQGCVLGQLAGDALGSLVEFKDAETIRTLYPEGIRALADGGVWDTIAGQPTDDSELALARSLVRNGAFTVDDVRAAYVRWLDSGPFDIGHTTRCGLAGRPLLDSESNGALMRVSPLGIFGWTMHPRTLAECASDDAALTHPNNVCRQVNGLCATAVAEAIREGLSGDEVYERIAARAAEWDVHGAIRERIERAPAHRPPEYSRQMGWVLTAFQNALHELVNGTSLDASLIETVHQGGDTDTNAAICGALLGAVHGREAIPRQWAESIAACRATTARSRQPRPAEYWPHDALELAERLVQAGASANAPGEGRGGATGR